MYVQPCTTYIRDMHQKAVFWVSGTSYHFSFTTLVLVEILDNLNCQLDARVPFRDGQHKFNNHPNAVSNGGWFFWFLMIRKWRFFPHCYIPSKIIKNHDVIWKRWFLLIYDVWRCQDQHCGIGELVVPTFASHRVAFTTPPFFAHDSVPWLLRHCEAVQQTS